MNQIEQLNQIIGVLAAAVVVLVALLIIGAMAFVGYTESSNADYNVILEKYREAQNSEGAARAGTAIAWKSVREREAEVERLETENALLIERLQRAETQMSDSSPSERVLFEGKHTNMYRCMDYRSITNKKSLQYALQHDERVVTRSDGIRALQLEGEEYYCAALGGYFGWTIGDAWSVELRNGYKFNMVLGEYKHPVPKTPEEIEKAKTDYGDPDKNYLKDDCINVIEFIVDLDKVPSETGCNVLLSGTMSAVPTFGGLYTHGGDIVDVQHIGVVWNNIQ